MEKEFNLSKKIMKVPYRENADWGSAFLCEDVKEAVKRLKEHPDIDRLAEIVIDKIFGDKLT